MKRVFIETYGCQMNQADSGIVGKILVENGYNLTIDEREADIILINTCAVRDNAEKKIHNRIHDIKAQKKKNPYLKIGIIGCMAERLKESLINEDKVDIVAGPDSYRNLPILIEQSNNNDASIDVNLSIDETYQDIVPIELNTNNVTAFISIMRGCENFCSYCVVPYTRGKERSRSPQTIINQAKNLFEKGYRDITLLGQNVNSYIYNKGEKGKEINFAKLMSMIADINPLLRVRFATSHPKDISKELIETIAKYNNICKYVHLPVQSGSNSMLKKMNRKYTVEEYKDKISWIKEIIPECSISTDIITGFCGETIEDHQQTLDVMRFVGYDSAYMFKYSQRPGTFAAKKYEDNITEEEKIRRLEEIIELQRELSLKSNEKDIGKVFEVLVESESKRDATKFFGRNSQNKVIIFDKANHKVGEYVNIKVNNCTSATLFGNEI